jgi:hypothetical protein
MHYAIKHGCHYSKYSPESSWYSFYHDEVYSSGSGPSKSSQRLALWHRNLCVDWPYLGLKGMLPQDIQNHYHCSDAELAHALIIIDRFYRDVERKFV